MHLGKPGIGHGRGCDRLGRGRSAIGRLRGGRGSGFGFFLFLGSGFLGRGVSGCGTIALKDQQHGAFGDTVALGDLYFLHHASCRGGHFHRGLVGFQFDDRILFGDGIANADKDRDHRNIGEIADVRHFYFYGHSLSSSPAYTRRGFGFPPSMSYFLSAASRSLSEICPSRHRSTMAAAAMWFASTSKKRRRLTRLSDRPKPSVPSTVKRFGTAPRICSA